ncbi:Gfo/Idh/MocA family oxidoreductase [Colwellia asteriadis]|uniref:Gfo/Idh/MocA family oxidoreductase n=1 Tax=Colwellia asteriadis TaxID=517723 RepID=A0ABN1L4D8_9GAMM
MTKLRIALLGLGDIAKKAYLPIVANNPEVEPILCSRNLTVLNELQDKYRINEAYQTLAELIASKPDAIMIHSATESHFAIAKQSLSAGIATFVDKPLSLSFAECQVLIELAKANNAPLYVGFNRRKAPLVAALTPRNLQHVIWQKNRVNLPALARDFIFNDFIHVVDSLLFLAKCTDIDQVKNLTINVNMQDKLLTRIHLSFTHQAGFFEGSMNRLSGVSEEHIEAFSADETTQINSLTSGYHFKAGVMTPLGFNDWQSHLYQRGFNGMIEEWLAEVKSEQANLTGLQAILISHQLCEKLVAAI